MVLKYKGVHRTQIHRDGNGKKVASMYNTNILKELVSHLIEMC